MSHFTPKALKSRALHLGGASPAPYTSDKFGRFRVLNWLICFPLKNNELHQSHQLMDRFAQPLMAKVPRLAQVWWTVYAFRF